MELKVAYNGTTKTVSVLYTADAIPVGSVNIGTFNHPDLVYPDSVVIYHGVRDLLYKRSAANPSQTAKYPYNICNMQEITILPLPEVVTVVPHFVTQPPASIDKSDQVGFVKVTFTGFPNGAALVAKVFDSSGVFVGSTSASASAGSYTLPYGVIPVGTGYVIRITDTDTSEFIESTPFDIVA